MTVLESLIRPASVAIVGASEDPRKMNGASVHNLIATNYDGRIYPVNPSRDTVQGITCYPSLGDLPECPDTLVIVTPAGPVVSIIEEAGTLGISTATIVSAGFGEGAAGSEGQAREQELRQALRSSGVRVIGPNTAGLLNLNDNYVPRAALNHLDPDDMVPGRVAIVTQSGAISNVIHNRAQVAGVGIHSVIATGDQIDLDVWDVAEAVIQEPKVSSLAMVIESLGQPEKIARVSELSFELDKMVAVLPLGVSRAGREMVMSHTGSIAAEGAIVRSVLYDAGFALPADFDHLWAVCGMVDSVRELDDAFRLGVFCLSGGEAAFIADKLQERGIKLPDTSINFERFVGETMSFAAAGNPFDATGEIIGQPELLPTLVEKFFSLNDFSHVLISAPLFRDELAMRFYPTLSDVADGYPGRVLLTAWSGGDMTKAGIEQLRNATSLFLEGSSLATSVLGTLLEHNGRFESKRPPLSRVDVARGTSETPRTEIVHSPTYSEARDMLAEAGLPFLEHRLTRSVGEAVGAATELGYPVVVKGDVPSSVHKASQGLVHLGLSSQSDVEGVIRQMSNEAEVSGPNASTPSAFVIERMCEPGMDVLVGGVRHKGVGVSVAFGTGGAMVEYVDDVAIGVGSFDLDRAIGLIARTGVGKFLEDRSQERVNELAHLVVKFARWFTQSGLRTAEVNPLRLVDTTGHWYCLDARLR